MLTERAAPCRFLLLKAEPLCLVVHGADRSDQLRWMWNMSMCGEKNACSRGGAHWRGPVSGVRTNNWYRYGGLVLLPPPEGFHVFTLRRLGERLATVSHGPPGWRQMVCRPPGYFGTFTVPNVPDGIIRRWITSVCSCVSKLRDEDRAGMTVSSRKCALTLVPNTVTLCRVVAIGYAVYTSEVGFLVTEALGSSCKLFARVGIS